MKSVPIPVWILTGYLGSGKTTLLSRWLRHDALSGAALIINEIGEIGFDDQVLAQSTDSASVLLADQCVCCSGLPGLQEALTELWWARLRRERPRFDAVVIETTGLANPRPLAQLFTLVPLLRERYVLQGIITAISAAAGSDLLADHEEVRAQVQAADAIILTKTDCTREEANTLASRARIQNPRAPVLQSAHASVAWPDIAAAVTEARHGARPAAAQEHTDPAIPTAAFSPRKIGPVTSSAGAHGMESAFHACSDPVSPEAWPAWLGPLLTPGLQRLKGIVQLHDQTLASVQWSRGDTGPTFTSFSGPAPLLGITTIRQAKVCL